VIERADPASPGISVGLVIAHLGKSLAVETASGELLVCQSRRRIIDVAVGDRVQVEATGHDSGVVTAVLPRSTELLRPARGGRTRTVAANIQHLWIVLAVAPEPDFLLVDQILAVSEHRGSTGGLLINKIDLAAERRQLDSEMHGYAAAGYPVLEVSAHAGAGLAALQERLRSTCSMLAGQSGVGKSSLTNALIPDRSLRVNELSAKSGLGRHTTTTATLYHLPGGGDLIDSPGVTVFGLAQMNGRDIAHGYREFREFIGRCRFNDCRHLDDMGCAVRGAVDAGQLSPARHARYRRLLEKGISAAFLTSAPTAG
jgi:ribosome biogenesis GTPase